LTEIGSGGQESLSKARVLCVGAGGLGSPALMYLAAAGIGTLGVIDGDRVDASNLQRQVLFTEADIGRAKTVVAAERLQAMNSVLRVVSYDENLHSGNAVRIFGDYDVVLDGTDNFAAKFLINDACVKLNLPMVYGSISQFEGQVSVFWAEHGPCYRCLHPAPPKAHIQNCAEGGVLGGIAGVVGSMMAMEAIKVVLVRAAHSSRLKPLIGRLQVVDLATNETMTLRVPKRAGCVLCSGRRDEIVLHHLAPVVCQGSMLKSISEEELRAALSEGAVKVFDVREASEWNRGHIAGSVHFALSRLESAEVPMLVRQTPLIVLCQVGGRSRRAEQILRSHGFLDVRNFTPGIAGWSGELQINA
jgi:adenylyltransferase/sulfurtransferase